ncbi:MAG: hypothetical protein ACLUEQ_05175 [Cloacibacillus evryensis]
MKIFYVSRRVKASGNQKSGRQKMPSRSLAVRQKLAIAAQKRPAALLIRCLFFSDLDDLTAL